MYYYIVYSSVTFATAVRNKFRFDRQQISVVHTPSVISGTGCSYSIRLKNKQKAMEIINYSKEYGVSVKGFYEQNSNGEFIRLS